MFDDGKRKAKGFPPGQSGNPARQFQPGVSGNPTGRPKSRHLSKAYRDVLDSVIPGDPEGRTYAEGIAHALAKRALKGEVSAAAELADRVEGRPRQSILVGREEQDVDTAGIIARLTGRGTQEIDSGRVAGDSSSAVEQ